MAEPIEFADSVAGQPQIALDANGNGIAVWQQRDRITADSIYDNRYTAGAWGTADGTETSDDPAGAPQIAIDGLGNAIAVWEQQDSGTGNSSIWANRLALD